MNKAALFAADSNEGWELPSRGIVGMLCLILAEATIFLIFVVAYVYYIGRSVDGPTPRDVLSLPIFTTVCLLSSSITVHLAASAVRHRRSVLASTWLAVTLLLGIIFISGTALEWYHLIYHDGLTIQTNLFGTTFYSLVGLHATHVIFGLLMLFFALFFSLRGDLTTKQSNRMEVLALYWHFVDAVWVVVFLLVYVLGR
jgi:cytochrome c oxidase subunit 3